MRATVKKRRCTARVEDTDKVVFRCLLPDDHFGWHMDEYRMVDPDGRRLPCEIRWAKATYSGALS